MANAIAVYATAPNYIKTVAPKLAARVCEYVNSHPTLKHIIQFDSIAAAGGAGATAMMPDDAKAAPMLDLLTNFMDRPVTQNRLLDPFLPGKDSSLRRAQIRTCFCKEQRLHSSTLSLFKARSECEKQRP